MEEHAKNILRELMREAELEEDFIAFYTVLMQDNVVNCLAENAREEFRSQIKILCDDSKQHYVLVKQLEQKYVTP